MMTSVKIAPLFRTSLRVVFNGIYLQHCALSTASTNLEALVTKLANRGDKIPSESLKTVPVADLKEVSFSEFNFRFIY